MIVFEVLSSVRFWLIMTDVCALVIFRVKSEVVSFNLGRTRLGGGGRVGMPPLKLFLSFLLEDITSAPDVFSSCSFIPRAHFESSSVMVSFYGYEI